MMGEMHTIELTTRDGHSLSFECGEGESLLAGATRHGLTLPSICREGSCGACHAHCRSGRYQAGQHNPAALSAEAAARGEVLLCSTYPRGPLHLAVAQDRASIEAGPLPERGATVLAAEPVGGEVIRLELSLEADQLGNAGASFEPGQYMELSPQGEAFTRAYSIANTPNWEGRMEFFIRLQEGGRFSTWLRQARPGDRLVARGPSGNFRLNEGALGPRWFIAGGTGLAPVLSMLRWMGELQAMQPARVYFGVNDEDALFAQAELEALKAQLPCLKVEICLWRPGESWQGFTGTPATALQRDLEALSPQAGRPEIYVCGPPPLIDAVEQLAETQGLVGRLHSERFLPT